ncbi:LiaF transmembrane domain-containing protein [Miniphocaeibacter massiliensis]|uniref:LiaF transmembrane domain-containing protein n=1 Tax=Miniphocaeibacter massiliensis TaxID=2041841 RepID=UPI000C1BE593|nr:hypothetical protein [Miniphocaeibacter massiliensis]
MTFLGLMLIIIGLFSIIEVFTNINLWFQFTDFWPLLLIVYGIYKLIKHRKAKVSSFLIIAIGIIFQLDKLGLLTPKLSTIIWASTLIIIGIILIIPDKAKKKFQEMKKNNTTNFNKENNSNKNHHNKENYYDEVNDDYDVNNKQKKYDFSNMNSTNNSYYNTTSEKTAYEPNFNNTQDDIFTEIGSNLIDLSYIFSNNKIKIRSSSFSGGDISTTFGQTILDLRRVYPASKIIEIYCNVYVSNLELLLPYNWNYEIIGKTTDIHTVEDAECTVRIFYKNILGEIIINQ